MTTAATAPPPPTYDAAFYDNHTDDSLRSARAVLPVVRDLVHPRSVVEVGCGAGAWLKAWEELGVADVFGIDGDYVDRSRLLIAADKFRPADLSSPAPLGRTFDLASCLEVGEHLPAKASAGLVKMLTAAAPVVLFSAAVPNQKGTHHVNERWPHYWRQLFAAEGYVRLDPVRPRVWRNPDVVWWYKQNIYVYARESVLAERPELRAEYELSQACPFELVHESVLAPAVRATTLGGMLRALPGAAAQAVRRLF